MIRGFHQVAAFAIDMDSDIRRFSLPVCFVIHNIAGLRLTFSPECFVMALAEILFAFSTDAANHVPTAVWSRSAVRDFAFLVEGDHFAQARDGLHCVRLRSSLSVSPSRD